MDITRTTQRPATRRPIRPEGSDPIHPPTWTTPIGGAAPRDRVAVRGTVLAVEVVPWVGGAVLEAAVSDGTGTLVLAFLGRRHVGGIEVGRRLTVAGAIVARHGRSYLLNPTYWLATTDVNGLASAGGGATKVAPRL